VAVSGYLRNRLELVKALGEVNHTYGANGAYKAKTIAEEIGRIDAVVVGLLAKENKDSATI
jgi:predicted transcriptional regulator